ncbi:hypothetical protein [Haladaptatus sp. DYF46]|uniref:hypothetical protein n=1 Tax=Haladaptatus sp. DYF46 TaxID=2886041 RepID=UPI001E6162DC|nr:hypothetical protein [Haladaptatus sp. DYF46]
MPTKISFGDKTSADSIREQFADNLCPNDDRRLKTVAFKGDTPDGVLDAAYAEAEDSRAEQSKSARMSGPLGEGEREQISEFGGFGKGTSTYNWRKAKGVFEREGLMNMWSDALPALVDWDDPEEGAEEWIANHRSSAQHQGTHAGGDYNVGEEDIKHQQRAADAARRAQSEGCDHARGHCEHGDAGACEHLEQVCGYSPDEVEQLLSDPRTEDTTQQEQLVTLEYHGETMDVTPEEAGALHRSWQGYKGATAALDRHLSTVRQSVIRARQAFRAINAIRTHHDQDELHSDKLHDLLDALDAMPASIPETRTLAHFAGEETDKDGETGIERDDQRTLGGERASDQTRFAGGERGPVESEVEEVVEENPGGLAADRRETTSGASSTEQQIPDEFRVAEGGQETL